MGAGARESYGAGAGSFYCCLEIRVAQEKRADFWLFIQQFNQCVKIETAIRTDPI